MSAFDLAITNNYLDNFKGYTGNPPTNKEEYDALDCWKDVSKAPTWDDISKHVSNETVRNNRSIEYPKLADQLDMLWHAIEENKLDTTSDFYQSLKAVKDKYPKGS